MEKGNEKMFQEPQFNCASVPLAAAAKALNLDKQTVRIMLQQKLVDWGEAVRLPGSSTHLYIISPRKFWLATGYVYKNEVNKS